MSKALKRRVFKGKKRKPNIGLEYAFRHQLRWGNSLLRSRYVDNQRGRKEVFEGIIESWSIEADIKRKSELKSKKLDGEVSRPNT